MKAIANLRQSISIQDKQRILNALNTILDIRAIDLDIENGVLVFRYQNRLALDLAERKLWDMGHPITSYSYPDRRVLDFGKDDTDYDSLV
ncbi:MAG TPA: hypothetical protein VLZ54_04000 [Arenibacter sp.]|nr:hypothetical protein [Arenibacter sp.]